MQWFLYGLRGWDAAAVLLGCGLLIGGTIAAFAHRRRVHLVGLACILGGFIGLYVLLMWWLFR